MKSMTITPAPLKGSLDVPPSKSLCHRAIIAAALAKGSSIINNVVLSQDILATIEAVQALGAEVTLEHNKAHISRANFSKISNSTIDCRESGSTLRFIIPLSLSASEPLRFIGSGNLSNRPIGPYIDIFNEQGIKYTAPGLPITIKGKLKPDEFKLRGDISSQFITGLMFALPVLHDDSSIHITSPLESKSYVDLTIDTLKSFGIHIENYNYEHFYIKGRQQYNPTIYSVEGDYSQAAFWITAGLFGTQTKCENLNLYSKQADKAFIDILKRAGAKIETDMHTVTALKSPIQAFDADVSQCPDIAPILAVVAALSKGTSRITGAARLRIKECDRLNAIATELNKLGAKVTEGEDYLIIEGQESLKGGVADSWNDHRIAMALSIASIKCTSPVVIKNSSVVSKSYPDFYQDFAKLGGIIYERSLG